jgi:hypothetical protein
MFNRFDINSTQLIGLMSFITATIACLIAARRPDSRDARIWKMLAFINLLFVIEVYIGLRHEIAALAKSWLVANGLYANMHGGIQAFTIALVATSALIFAALMLASRSVASGGARLAAGITVAAFALFTIEIISLHALDALFYRPLGPVAVIGWMWLIAAVGISLATFRR